jgi:hypothetical protein
MSGTLPWSRAPSTTTVTDPTESLRRIEQNTAGVLQWMKILVGAVIALILVNVLLFV